MIIVRVPFRLPIGGGATDLKPYYSQFGGHLITASINQYMFVFINESATSDKIKLYYDKTEIVNEVKEIQHNIIRESLKLHGINRAIEIGSMADIDSGTGMGSSSAFTVALLAGINTLERKFISQQDLAEEACKVEIDLVGKPIGKQDQYAVTFGGINEFVISREGDVTVHPLRLEKETIFELENRLLMFYTNVRRDANEILAEQSEMTKKTVDSMHQIKEIGRDIRRSLLAGNIDDFGHRLHNHWMVKKSISKKMSSNTIDKVYEFALKRGALGGKIMGAGGGGLLLFCAREGKRKQLIESMEHIGLRNMDFRFEFEGVKIITNI